MMNFYMMSLISIPFLLLSLASFGLWLWALIDCLKSKREDNEKILWVIVIAVFNLIGAILYLLIAKDRPSGKKKKKKNETDKTVWIIVGVAVAFFLLLSVIAVAGLAFFGIATSSEGSISRETNVVVEDGATRAYPDMIADIIVNNRNFTEYGGENLSLEMTERLERGFCKEAHNISRTSGSEDCHIFDFTFDIDEDKLDGIRGFDVEAVTIDGEIVNIEFYKKEK